MKKIIITGIMCASCNGPLEKKLNPYSLAKYCFDGSEQTVTLEFENALEQKVIAAIEDLGHEYQLIDLSETNTDKNNNFDDFQLKEAMNKQVTNARIKKFLFRGVLAGVIALPLFILSFISVSLPFVLLCAIPIVTFFAMLISGYEIYCDAFKAFMSTRSLNMNSLFTMSTAIAFIASCIALIFPVLGLPIFFEAALMILSFRNIGLAIKENAQQKVKQGLKFRDQVSNQVTKLTNYEAELGISNRTVVTLDEIDIGDVIIVPRGETIAFDGIVIDHDAVIIDKITSGDATPRTYTKGSKVFAGFEVVGDGLVLEVTKKEKDSYLTTLDDTISDALGNKPRIEELANRVINYFVPAVFVCALLSALFVSLFASPLIAISTAISVLVVACPCVFGLVVPLAVKIASSKAARHGVTFIKTEAIQRLNKVDTIVFDKTGTLTRTVVNAISSYDDENWDEGRIINFALALEKKNEHIIAETIRTHALQNFNSMTSTINLDLDEATALGVSGKRDGIPYLLGDLRFLQEKQIHLEDEYENAANTHQSEGNNLLFLVEDERIVATILIEQQLKPDVPDTFRELRRRGFDLKICTGTGSLSNDDLERLGFTEADLEANLKTKCTPVQKKEYIETLQQQGKVVAMVGDGKNDPPAMAASHVSFVMQSADETTKDNADVILSDRSFQPLLNAITVSKQAMSNIKQNLAMTIAYNIIMIAVAGGALLVLGFVLNPAFAAAFMILESTCILLNAYRFKRKAVLPRARPLRVAASLDMTSPLLDSDSGSEDGKQHDMQTVYGSLFSTENSVPEDIVSEKVVFEKVLPEEVVSSEEVGLSATFVVPTPRGVSAGSIV